MSVLRTMRATLLSPAKRWVLRRVRSKRTWVIWLIVLVLCVIFVIFQTQHPMYFRLFSGVKSDNGCTSAATLREIVKLTEEVHEILNKMNLTHFLMYGTHWGALRVEGPLPWDFDADIGVLGDQNYHKLGDVNFVNAFASKGMRITNNMVQKTSLKLDRGSVAHIDVIVYFDYGGVMKRRGWEPLVLPIHYHLHHSFPTYLVNSPPALPQLKFGNIKMPVPRDGREIMKYLYRYDWWKNYKPAYKCETVKF